MRSRRVHSHSCQYASEVAVRALLTIIMTALIATACGGSGITLPDDADQELFQGLAVYQQRCAQCHGQTGGGGIGANIQDVESRLTDAEQREVVVNGRNNAGRQMPAFGAVLSESDIDAVVRFTREILEPS